MPRFPLIHLVYHGIIISFSFFSLKSAKIISKGLIRYNYNFYMFALLEIARIYKALKRFADLQGPICYNDAQNKGMNLIVY